MRMTRPIDSRNTPCENANLMNASSSGLKRAPGIGPTRDDSYVTSPLDDSGMGAGRARSPRAGERLGRHPHVHHQELKVVAVAERVEGVLGAVGVGVAVAHADGLAEQGHRRLGLGRR